MRHNLTCRGSIAVIAALGAPASLGSASAANAQELSPGCQALNDPRYDALVEVSVLEHHTFAVLLAIWG